MANRSPEALTAQVQHLQRQIDAVYRTAAALSSRTDLDDLLRQTLQVSLDTVGAGAGSILLHSDEQDQLVFRYVIGGAGEDLVGVEIPPDQGLCWQAFRSGEALISGDVAKESQHLRALGEQLGYATRNMVTMPLKRRDGAPIGVMQVLNKASGDFEASDCELLEILCALAATVIENARLAEEARLAQVVKVLGDISHDIKNMMTPVQTCAQTLDMMLEDMFAEVDEVAESEGVAESAREGLEMATVAMREFHPEAVGMLVSGSLAVQERVREIADCVKGIIAEPQFEATEVGEVVAQALQPLKLVGEKAGVNVWWEQEEGLPQAPVDRKQLYNAVYNLVNNAIPETPPGGQVVVTLSARRDGPFPEGSYLEIQVADTGGGMPEEVRAKLFTDDAKSTKPGGTGLGTRIVKNVVDAHGGVITVASEPGQGSTFCVRLPLCR